VKRTVTIHVVAETETEYHLMLGLILRQLQKGQIRGEGTIGLAAYSYRVETDHSDAPSD
jgi:hypothetical protein